MRIISIEEMDIDDFKTIITLEKKKDLEYLANKYKKEIFCDINYLFICTPHYVYEWRITKR